MNEKIQIEEAARAKAAATAALYRDDGSKRFAGAEHEERQQAIERDFSAAMDRIEEAISERVGEAERELLVAENADVADALTTSELERANAKSQFVAADAQRVSLDKLAQRCRAAAASGDKASMFLWSHNAYARVGDSDVTSDEPGADEVREVVAELRAKLDPDAERKLAEARQALAAAQELREKAYYRRRGATDAFELYARAAYGTPSSS